MIRQYTGLRFPTGQDKQELGTWLRAHGAPDAPTEEELRECAYARLRALGLELPATQELRRLVQAALRGFFQDVYDRVVARLSAPVRTALDTLLVVGPEETQSLFDRLKAEPATPGVKNLQQEVTKLHALRTLALPAEALTDVPWIAERDEAADGGRRWTFHLRRGVKFHDGSELTAEAVHYSFVRLLALGKGPSAIFKRMGLTAERIRVVDSYTVEFSLDQPFGPFRVAIPLVSIVNPALLKAHEQDVDWGEKWLARNEAGSGAFRLVKADASSGLTMTRFPEF